jgi:hypothetical protein
VDRHLLKLGLWAVVFTINCGFVEAKKNPESTTDFFVLRADRVTVWVSAGHHENLSCTVIGTGYSAQMRCTSYSTEGAIPLVYNTALLVGSDGVGYIVKCGGGLLRRIGCHALRAGVTVQGSIDGGKLSLLEENKTASYRIVTSAYVGRVSQEPPPEANPNLERGTRPQLASEGIMIQPAIHPQPVTSLDEKRSAGPESPGQLHKDQGNVMLMSEPKGAEIYVDEKFVGSTPSVVTLLPGPHELEIKSDGFKPWRRKLEVTSGSKVTVQAILEK